MTTRTSERERLKLRFGSSLIRKVKRCFTCYKPTESASGSKERYKGMMSCNLSETTSCGDGGCSEMIQNAISYCKDSLIKGDTKANETPLEEPETEAKVLDIPSPCSMDIDSQTSNQLPQVINGVPKGLRIEDLLGRIAVLLLIRDKVANFEYIDEVEAAAEEEARKASTENKTTTNNPDRASYWEESLKDRYEVQKFEEFNAMGKGNRSRKQMVSVEDEDLAGLEDVSSEGEDNNYEAELTDEETAASGILTGRRPYRKKIRVDSAESLPLMEGEGRSFRVKGFNQNQSSGACQTSHWKSGHKTKCKDFQLSGQAGKINAAWTERF